MNSRLFIGGVATEILRAHYKQQPSFIRQRLNDMASAVFNRYRNRIDNSISYILISSDDVNPVRYNFGDAMLMQYHKHGIGTDKVIVVLSQFGECYIQNTMNLCHMSLVHTVPGEYLLINRLLDNYHGDVVDFRKNWEKYYDNRH